MTDDRMTDDRMTDVCGHLEALKDLNPYLGHRVHDSGDYTCPSCGLFLLWRWDEPHVILWAWPPGNLQILQYSRTDQGWVLVARTATPDPDLTLHRPWSDPDKGQP